MIVEIHGVGQDVASRQTAVITNNGIVCIGPGLGALVLLTLLLIRFLPF